MTDQMPDPTEVTEQTIAEEPAPDDDEGPDEEVADTEDECPPAAPEFEGEDGPQDDEAADGAE